MKNLIDTNALVKYVLSLYNIAIPLMKADGICMPLNAIFRENVPTDNEGEFCFTDFDRYHFRALERGVILRDNTTQSLSEITYWAIKNDVSEASAIYESKNRIPNQDFRRVMFAKRLHYFEAIGTEYAQIACAEIGIILKKAPFQDE